MHFGVYASGLWCVFMVLKYSNNFECLKALIKTKK